MSRYLVNASWTILPGQETAARRALAELASEVRENEDDTLFYLIHSPDDTPGVTSFPPRDPREVIFIEGYRNRRAFQRHAAGAALKGFIARHGGLFLSMYGPGVPFVMVDLLELQAGYLRPAADTDTLYMVIARWDIRPGRTAAALKALRAYVRDVRKQEPATYMYTVSTPDRVALSFPTVSPNALVYNSGWRDQAAFQEHVQGKPYQDLLGNHGRLFRQSDEASAGHHPYITSVVLKRFAGFFRPEVFAKA